MYACFCWRINILSTVYLSEEFYHGQISIGLGYVIFHLFSVEKYDNAAAVKITEFNLSIPK